MKGYASYTLHDITVIAGFPLVDKLEDLQSGATCIWTKIDPDGQEAIIDFAIADKTISQADFVSLCGGNIAKLVEASKSLSWYEAIDKINEVRRSDLSKGKYFHHVFSGDLYKPVYFLIHDDKMNSPLLK